jgi:hypothetical protein
MSACLEGSRGQGRLPRIIPRRPAGLNHDQQFHQPVVDISGRRGLQDENVFVSYRFAYDDRRLLVGVVDRYRLGDFDSQPRDEATRSRLVACSDHGSRGEDIAQFMGSGEWARAIEGVRS